MDRFVLHALKNRIGLVDYLRHYQWQPCCKCADGQVVGLCPLHTETKPSFTIHPFKNLFYCHGCGRGGDLIRLVELFHGLSFSQSLAHLRQLTSAANLWDDALNFYRTQLRACPEAIAYLAHRGLHAPATIEALRIGYAPGICLRAHLRFLGHSPEAIRQSRLINPQGRDTLFRRIVFPLAENFYGRSIDAASPHRFLRPKGGLYRWDCLHSAPHIILVEGFFDLAALHQAGFTHVTCAGGSRLNPTQFQQLTTGSRTVWIAFDGDRPGQQAAAALSARLLQTGQPARRVFFPFAHDPASFFAAGATAAHFRALLQEALP